MNFLKKATNYKTILFVIVFAYLTIWIWQGIDLTDTGMFLTKQWMVFNGGAESELDIVFGATFAGGLWNSFLEGNYLIWAYFGSVFINSLSILMVYLILSDYFNKKLTFLTVLSITPLLVVPTIKVINYNDLPLCLILLVIYFISKSFLAKTSKLSIVLMIVSGIVYAAAIISRLTLIIFIFFPIILILYNLYFKNYKIKWFKNALYFSAGLIFGLSIIFLALFKYGLLISYLGNIYNAIFSGLFGGSAEAAPLTFTHSLGGTIEITLRKYYLALFLIPVTLIFLSISSYLKRIKNKVVKYTLLILYCLLVTWFIYYNLGVYGYYNYIYYILFGLNIFIILVCIYKSRDKKKNFILLIVLYSQMIVNFGSIVINWTNMFLSTSLSLILLFSISRTKFSDKFKSVVKFANLRIFLIIILIILGITTNYFNIYRDSSNRLELTHGFKTSNLKGIFTTEERAEAIDEVIKKVRNSTKPHDEILCTNNIPLLYYLTETKPSTREPWALNFYTTQAFEEELTEIFTERSPKVVVVAKGSTRRDREWPKNIEEVGVHSRNVDKLMFVYTIISKYDYQLYWENEGFELFKKNVWE